MRNWLDNHGTKVLGYVVSAAAIVTLMDKELVIRTLGPTAPDWALLIAGLGAIGRGHQVTAREKRERETKPPTNGDIP